MYWEKIFGEALYEKIKKYCKDNKYTISSFVRMLVHQFFDEKNI